MERCSVEHRAFAVETYFKNNDSVVTQLIFRRHFNIHWNDSVHSRNTVLLWVRNFRETAFAAKKENVQEESLHLELLRTSNDCVRLLSEVLRLREMC